MTNGIFEHGGQHYEVVRPRIIDQNEANRLMQEVQNGKLNNSDLGTLVKFVLDHRDPAYKEQSLNFLRYTFRDNIQLLESVIAVGGDMLVARQESRDKRGVLSYTLTEPIETGMSSLEQIFSGNGVDYRYEGWVGNDNNAILSPEERKAMPFDQRSLLDSGKTGWAWGEVAAYDQDSGHRLGGIKAGENYYTGGAALNPNWKPGNMGGAHDTKHFSQQSVTADLTVGRFDTDVAGFGVTGTIGAQAEITRGGQGFGTAVRGKVHDYLGIYPGDETTLAGKGWSGGVGARGEGSVQLAGERGEAGVRLDLGFDGMFHANSDVGTNRLLGQAELVTNFGPVSAYAGVKGGYEQTPGIANRIANAPIPTVTATPYIGAKVHPWGEDGITLMAEKSFTDPNGVSDGFRAGIQFPLN